MPEQPSLAGPLARIDRANELLPHLDAALKAFLQTPPYDIEERPDPNPTTRAFVTDRKKLTVKQAMVIQVILVTVSTIIWWSLRP